MCIRCVKSDKNNIFVIKDDFNSPVLLDFGLPVRGCLSQFAIREAGQKIVYILGFRLLSEGPDVKNAMLRRC